MTASPPPQQALSLKICDLVISNSRVGGQAGVDLIIDLRKDLPWISILYLANRATLVARPGGATARLMSPILREPFTAEELRAAVSSPAPEVADGRSRASS